MVNRETNSENYMHMQRAWVRLYDENAEVTDEYLQIIGRSYASMGYEVNYVRKLEDIKAAKDEVIVLATAIDVFKYLRRGFRHVVYWAQGVWPEESYLRHGSRLRFSICGAIENAALRGAEKIFLVSDAMLRHYEEKYDISIAEKSMVMACSNETLHPEAFYVEGKYENPVFTYAGSLVSYQCVDQMLEAFRSVREKLPRSELLLFTGEVEEARRKVEAIGVSGVIVDCKPRQELWRHISRAKYGFVLREDRVVNRVATPTKISSYLANGVIPVYSKCLESFSETSSGIPRLAYDPATFVEDVVRFEQMSIDPAEIESQYAGYFRRHLDLSAKQAEIELFLAR
ncbi:MULTISPECIES: hypothetical protein [Coriobacteriales]|uniref:hypothetical protein n=1 Tax=Coriobacteriales TaxID=84999 RepID=UPI00235651FA|nr:MULTISPECIES: hypothetical protein [Coriobacteriales]MDM8163937.1 hypothetical protein [Collinsella intestinalis]